MTAQALYALKTAHSLAVSSAYPAPPLASPEKVNTESSRTSAEIISYPKRKLPSVADYAGLCAGLIRETFPAPSQHQTCINAAHMTGASPDTIDRILSGPTKSPDAKLMLAVMAIRAAMGKRTFDLGNGFSIRIIMEGQE